MTTTESTNERMVPILLWLAVFAITTEAAAWAPAEGPLATRWTAKVTPENAHRRYPRPQMRRKHWLNLNGLWDYAVTAKEAPRPADWKGQILVPFGIESALSGVMRRVDETEALWYRRTFEIPRSWNGKNVMLNFEAVDWQAIVWVNGKLVGTHKGGYDPFGLDITEALKNGGRQEIVVSVWDPTDRGPQPRGKQVEKPGGIHYTPTTGIWQTVWLEPVNEAFIKELSITTDIDTGAVTIASDCSRALDLSLEAEVGGFIFPKASGGGPADRPLELKLGRFRCWSPERPVLYDLTVELKDAEGHTLDSVKSYFGMRKVSIARDEAGINRILLNNEPIFQYGPLDQGFWPDGLHTPPADEAIVYDLKVLKRIGCNMLRKHVKIESRRYYYWTDRLGILVWQDMPHGSIRVGRHLKEEDLPEAKRQFQTELVEMIETLRCHPSIVMWVVFNEGWGQHDTETLTGLVKGIDPSRLVNSASGWHDSRTGDIQDIHEYPGPAVPLAETGRALVLGEFGGLGLPVKGHTWQAEKNWGYGKYESRDELTGEYVRLDESRDELTGEYVRLVEKLRPLISMGLCGAVYTQTSDIETEVNGFLTYDRLILKPHAARIGAANMTLYEEPPAVTRLVPPGGRWRYLTGEPEQGWEKSGFDDSGWACGTAPFGETEPPKATAATELAADNIYIRRTFELSSVPGRPHLVVHCNQNKIEVYINGLPAAEMECRYPRRKVTAIDPGLLRTGANILAVSAVKKKRQFIDAAIISIANGK